MHLIPFLTSRWCCLNIELNHNSEEQEQMLLYYLNYPKEEQKDMY